MCMSTIRHRSHTYASIVIVPPLQRIAQVPQPIPHPAVIALLTFNRENEKDSLDLESVVTKRWLKIAEETVYDYSLHAHPPPKEIRTDSKETFNGSYFLLTALWGRIFE